jgi:hypothetical protein
MPSRLVEGAPALGAGVCGNSSGGGRTGRPSAGRAPACHAPHGHPVVSPSGSGLLPVFLSRYAAAAPAAGVAEDADQRGRGDEVA